MNGVFAFCTRLEERSKRRCERRRVRLALIFAHAIGKSDTQCFISRLGSWRFKLLTTSSLHVNNKHADRARATLSRAQQEQTGRSDGTRAERDARPRLVPNLAYVLSVLRGSRSRGHNNGGFVRADAVEVGDILEYSKAVGFFKRGRSPSPAPGPRRSKRLAATS